MCGIIWPLRIRQQLNGLSTTKIYWFTISKNQKILKMKFSKIRSSLTLWPTMPYKSSNRSIFIALQLCFLVKTWKCLNFVSFAVILTGTQFWPKKMWFSRTSVGLTAKNGNFSKKVFFPVSYAHETCKEHRTRKKVFLACIAYCY